MLKLQRGSFCSTFVTMKVVEVVAGVICDGRRFLATQRGYGEQKDGWEFPGGKMEPGETPEEALVRELQEELAVKVSVGNLVTTVEYDYPKFHLTMHTFLCRIISGEPTLLEHENSKWLDKSTIRSVDWLPADVAVVECLEKMDF